MLRAVPKNKDTSFEEIIIGLKDGTLVSMELKDSFGQSSVLTFKGLKKSGAECDEF
jgi:outer membrane lipoprotein carrier protein